jgi:hypothetical protein
LKAVKDEAVDPVNPKDEMTFAQSNLAAAVLATDDMVVMVKFGKLNAGSAPGQ